MMMDTVKEDFDKNEKDYKIAVSKKSLNLKDIAKRFDKSLNTYNASLNIKFDLAAFKEKMANKLDIKIPDEKKEEIKNTFKYLKNNKHQLVKMMKFKYDQFMERQKKHEEKPDDQEIAKDAALAEDEYETYKGEMKQKEDLEIKEAEEKEELENPDDEFEETEVTTTVNANGSITTTTIITTSEG